MTDTPLLTLDTVATYLKDREVQLNIEENDGQRFVRMGWRFEMGDAAILVSVNDADRTASRLEITCVTQKQYQARRAEVLDVLNTRNREFAFSRSIDHDGNVWLEYAGIYPSLVEWPRETFYTLFGGVLAHFQDDYQALEDLSQHLA